MTVSNSVDEQLRDYHQARDTAKPAIDKLFEVEDITGRLDTPAYRAFTRAHDLAQSLGHRAVDCVHMVMGMMLEPKSRDVFHAADPDFDSVAVLHACRAHLTDPSLTTSSNDLDSLHPADELREWFEAAERLTQDRGERNRYIEIVHMLKATPEGGQSGDFLKALELLKSRRVLTQREHVEEQVSTATGDIKTHVDGAALALSGSLASAATAITGHIDKRDYASKQRHAETRIGIVRFRRSFNRASRRLMLKSDTITRSIGVVDMRIAAEAQKISDTVHGAHTSVAAELMHIRLASDQILTSVTRLESARLSHTALVSGLLLSIAVGCTAGYFFSV